MESATKSGNVVDDMIKQGAAILQAYSQQRQHLKSAERKVLDVLNTMGLSNSLLRVVERRQLVDKVIVFGGMALVVLLTWGLWLLTHGARGGAKHDSSAAATTLPLQELLTE